MIADLATHEMRCCCIAWTTSWGRATNRSPPNLPPVRPFLNFLDMASLSHVRATRTQFRIAAVFGVEIVFEEVSADRAGAHCRLAGKQPDRSTYRGVKCSPVI